MTEKKTEHKRTLRFKKPKNQLELHGKNFLEEIPEIPDEMWTQCPTCKKILLTSELKQTDRVCSSCGYHFKLTARERIAFLCDAGSFEEVDPAISSRNLIDFPGYEEKLTAAREKSLENEAVITGTAQLAGFSFALFVMESQFMMGSMGAIVGEKITRLFEYATMQNLPVIGFTVSGGARMQEGIFSLMQMAKVSGAIARHGEEGNLYIAVLTDPTTGGVSASFAMQGDIILAEPGALIGFAGPRVIEQTIRQKLPEGFQRSEFLLEKGFVDEVVARPLMEEYLACLLSLHATPEGVRA